LQFWGMRISFAWKYIEYHEGNYPQTHQIIIRTWKIDGGRGKVTKAVLGKSEEGTDAQIGGGKEKKLTSERIRSIKIRV
jgi:uncharacterized protein affecting Mg2+/Co2+ transport